MLTRSTRVDRILLVDDEEKIIEVVTSYLLKEGYEVYKAVNGTDALRIFDEVYPSMVVLDLMLPDISGEDVCRIIRKKSRVPVIMLTAKVMEEDILMGLDIGADDYVTKPFSPRQLVARIRALIRRSSEDVVPLFSTMSFGSDDLVIDSQRLEVYKKGKIVNLTPIEYRVLLALVKYPNKTFTREELILGAMGQDYGGFDRTIDSHIKNLRQKIENDPKAPQYVVTVHGVGYKFGGGKFDIKP